jgi:hypothetical protein
MSAIFPPTSSFSAEPASGIAGHRNEPLRPLSPRPPSRPGGRLACHVGDAFALGHRSASNCTYCVNEGPAAVDRGSRSGRSADALAARGTGRLHRKGTGGAALEPLRRRSGLEEPDRDQHSRRPALDGRARSALHRSRQDAAPSGLEECMRGSSGQIALGPCSTAPERVASSYAELHRREA